MLEALQFPDVEMLNHMNYKILSIIKALQTVKIVNDVMTRFTQLKNFTIISQKYSTSVEPLQSVHKIIFYPSFNPSHQKYDIFGKINYTIGKITNNERISYSSYY